MLSGHGIAYALCALRYVKRQRRKRRGISFMHSIMSSDVSAHSTLWLSHSVLRSQSAECVLAPLLSCRLFAVDGGRRIFTRIACRTVDSTHSTIRQHLPYCSQPCMLRSTSTLENNQICKLTKKLLCNEHLFHFGRQEFSHSIVHKIENVR